jgi:tRNA-guanine family transglycosylase
MLGAQLATLHNLFFYFDLMRQIRAKIAAGEIEPWARARLDDLRVAEAT